MNGFEVLRVQSSKLGAEHPALEHLLKWHFSDTKLVCSHV